MEEVIESIVKGPFTLTPENVYHIPSKPLGALRVAGMVMVSLLAGCAVETEYVVNTIADVSDANPGDGTCAGGGGNVCSVRAAIEETNTHPAGELVRITIPEGVHELTGDPLHLTHDSVIIRGAGREATVVQQTSSGSNVLRITGPDDILVEALTLTGGGLTGIGPGGQAGGGVFVDGAGYRVTLDECRISNNNAAWLGGGIYAQGNGILNVLNCVVEENDSTGDGCVSGGGVSGGGGIATNGPTLSLIQSEVRDNCGSNGGGIRLIGGVNHLILRSTIAGNGSATQGGGLHASGGAAGRIEDSTIAENSGPGVAGVYVSGSGFSIINVTIAGNAGNAGNQSFLAETGGILSTNSALVGLTNTVIADNDGLIDDCSGPFLSGGGNFFGEDDASCTFAEGPSDILNGGDPDLGALGLNGGATRTMVPNANSPLVDNGTTGCAPIDQRNSEAPAGGGCDIGAVER